MEYVIVKVESGAITGYWDGAAFQGNIDLSDVQGTIQDARFLQGSIQTQDLNFDVEYRAADVSVVLV